jgi:hypothetical protein
MNDEGEHVKEVFAHFGLALYQAQVLEHGIVNALVILDLIPSKRHLVRSRKEWEQTVDGFMDRNFENTMGRMLGALREVAGEQPELDRLLREALRRRNWLSHRYFRERAVEFTNEKGREGMIAEIDECRLSFEAADKYLAIIVKPLWAASGITEELLEQAYREMLSETPEGQ